MKIIMYRGASQYGAFDIFIEKFKVAFEKKRYEVFVVDISQNGYELILEELIQATKIDLIIGFNGIGSGLKAGEHSLYDVVKIYYLAIYVDHPSHHIPRLTNYSQYSMASFLDKEHVSFVNDVIPDMQKMKFFMPLSGIESQNFERTILSLEQYEQEKDIELLFTGSYFGEPKKEWSVIKEFPHEMMDEFVNYLIEDDYISVREAMNRVLDKHALCFSNIGKVQMAQFFSLAVTYVRQYKRYIVLQEIFKSGLPITLYGKGWEEIASLYDNVDYQGELDIKDTADVTRRAKVVLNLNANFTHGAHDRVFTGMLNYAVVFTDRSYYYDEYFQEEQNILYYSMNSLETDIEKLKVLLEDSEKLFKMTQESYVITSHNHSWDKRANEISEMYKFVHAMDTLQVK